MNLNAALLDVSSADFFGSVPFLNRYNLNSTDAALLTAFLRYSQNTSEKCLLVSADKRFIRAATAEGLAVLDPEALPLPALPAFLSSL